MVSDATRLSAYAELVVGLLDVRDDAAGRRFDAELAAAESTGRIDADTARAIRWWQRETVRGLVAHAQTVLPPTLLAIEHSYRDSQGHEADETIAKNLVQSQSATGYSDDSADLPPEELPEDLPEVEVTDPPIDLTARRLLVAGLMPLRDP